MIAMTLATIVLSSLSFSYLFSLASHRHNSVDPDINILTRLAVVNPPRLPLAVDCIRRSARMPTAEAAFRHQAAISRLPSRPIGHHVTVATSVQRIQESHAAANRRSQRTTADYYRAFDAAKRNARVLPSCVTWTHTVFWE
jgi:hypothetical protein